MSINSYSIRSLLEIHDNNFLCDENCYIKKVINGISKLKGVSPYS